MKKKFLEILNGIGMVGTIVVMMLAVIALIFLVNMIYHAVFK